MLFFTHALFSIAIVGTFMKQNVLSVFLLCLGSAFPDIDAAGTALGKRFPFIEFLFGHRKIVHSIFGLIFFSALFFFAADVVFGEMINIFPEDKSELLMMTFFFAAGFFLHLVLDAITPAGIRLFYPFRITRIFETIHEMSSEAFDKRKAHVKKYDGIFCEKRREGLFNMRIRTGSLGELFIFLILLAYVFFLVLYSNNFSLI